MNFMDKVKILKEMYCSNEMSEDVKCHIVIEDNYVSPEFIEALKSRFPNLSESYLDFLRIYGNPELDWFNFYGESGQTGIPLFDILSIWERSGIFEFEKNGCCIIGEDSARDVYCINKQGEVIMFDSVNVEEPPKFIAESFDEFVGECILGKRYLEFMDEDNFYHFLQEQGWA